MTRTQKMDTISKAMDLLLHAEELLEETRDSNIGYVCEAINANGRYGNIGLYSKLADSLKEEIEKGY